MKDPFIYNEALSLKRWRLSRRKGYLSASCAYLDVTEEELEARDVILNKTKDMDEYEFYWKFHK